MALAASGSQIAVDASGGPEAPARRAARTAAGRRPTSPASAPSRSDTRRRSGRPRIASRSEMHAAVDRDGQRADPGPNSRTALKVKISATEKATRLVESCSTAALLATVSAASHSHRGSNGALATCQSEWPMTPAPQAADDGRTYASTSARWRPAGPVRLAVCRQADHGCTWYRLPQTTALPSVAAWPDCPRPPHCSRPRRFPTRRHCPRRRHCPTRCVLPHTTADAQAGWFVSSVSPEHHRVAPQNRLAPRERLAGDDRGAHRSVGDPSLARPAATYRSRPLTRSRRWH